VCGNVIRGRMVGVRCIALQITRETKSSRELLSEEGLVLRKSPGGDFLRSLVFAFVLVFASSGDRTVVFVVWVLLCSFRFWPFSIVFGTERENHRLLARS
jgi:hypothetical protein